VEFLFVGCGLVVVVEVEVAVLFGGVLRQWC
jgi:hypothetical protein